MSKSIDEIVRNDNSMLHRCIHALATGRRLERETNDNASFANERASSFAASDIIRMLATKKAGQLKEIVASQIRANPISQSFNKVLNKFGIAPSCTSIRTQDLIKSQEILLKGFSPHPHDLILLLYDNIGFRVCGSQPGWKQFTAMQVIRIDKSKLTEKKYIKVHHIMLLLSFRGTGIA